jgi:hypothetical protein
MDNTSLHLTVDETSDAIDLLKIQKGHILKLEDNYNNAINSLEKEKAESNEKWKNIIESLNASASQRKLSLTDEYSKELSKITGEYTLKKNKIESEHAYAINTFKAKNKKAKLDLGNSHSEKLRALKLGQSEELAQDTENINNATWGIYLAEQVLEKLKLHHRLITLLKGLGIFAIIIFAFYKIGFWWVILSGLGLYAFMYWLYEHLDINLGFLIPVNLLKKSNEKIDSLSEFIANNQFINEKALNNLKDISVESYQLIYNEKERLISLLDEKRKLFDQQYKDMDSRQKSEAEKLNKMHAASFSEFNEKTSAEYYSKTKFNDTEFEKLKLQLETQFSSNKQSIELQYNNSLHEANKKKDTEVGNLYVKYQTKLAEEKIKLEEGIDKIISAVNNIQNQLNQHSETFNPNEHSWDEDQVLKSNPMVGSNLRIGEETLQLNLGSDSQSISIPTCINFLNKNNLYFPCRKDTEFKQAIKAINNIVGRALLALPPNKLKLTFIDPLALGANASRFTSLQSDMYGGMVFTQQSDIENQLLALTRVIENIIQKYLQDRFTDISEYNQKQQEVPEPYRLLIIYDFPHGFTESTVNKLLNIMKSGPKAGVNTILLCDMNGKLPYNIDWNLISSGSNMLDVLSFSGRDDRFRFVPDEELDFPSIVKHINEAIPKTSSIKVAFTKYIGNKTEWWKEKAHKELMIPIGKHSTEIQNFVLNNELANQALLIGKPGSGKSNLLHIIIANALWKYGPDQLEIYLIDFKEGVEFGIYAGKNIPHIRALAIESEREFGESILQKIYSMIEERGKLCSEAGVENIERYNEKCYRENRPDKLMTRVLLIVDEFHVFFAEDDAISERVENMFATIIQKGRAYGLNTLFSSQTLSMRTMKRAITGLINIRISLMCSEEDAPLILDSNNSAARDLTRPGEGIYNEKGGKKEGNKLFQAFFMDKDDLPKVLEPVVALANEKNIHKEQIVFRGTDKAYLDKANHKLKEVVQSSSPKLIKLWLGEPVAISDDITASLRKQSGSNLLIVGFDESIGLRILSSCIISIAAHYLPDSCKLYSFNFFNVDTESHEIQNSLFQNIALNSSIRKDTIHVNARKVKESLTEIKTEIENRIKEEKNDYHHIYLIISSLQRGRVFRKDGYSMSEEGDLLSYILKEGPDVGVFSLVQIDTTDNFTKNLEDGLFKEFAQRVASQMNPENSAKIIGNRKAATLGKNRAYYYDDNEVITLKLKPYELPNISWINQFKQEQSILS